MFTIRLIVTSVVYPRHTVIIFIMTASFLPTQATEDHPYVSCENTCRIRRGEASCGGRGLVSARLTGCEAVSTIYLSYNVLTHLTSHLFPSFPNLKTLDLSNNPITFIEPGTFDNNLQLEEVILNDIKVRRLLNQTFDGLSGLEKLYCIHGKLEVLEERSLAGLHSLWEIDLSFNKIQNLSEDIFQDSVHLEIISLSVNRLSTLPINLFSNLHELRELYLVSNRLTVLQDGLFDGLDALEKLDLRRNGLTQVPLMNFRYLDLSLNDLTDLPFPGQVEGGIRWRTVKLKGNPLHCDHTIDALRDWYSCQRNKSCSNGTVTVDDWRCSSPARHNGELLDSVPSLTTTTAVPPTTRATLKVQAFLPRNDKGNDVYMGSNNRLKEHNDIYSSVSIVKGSYIMPMIAFICQFAI